MADPEDRISPDEEEAVKDLLFEVSYSGDDAIVPSSVNEISGEIRRSLPPRTTQRRLEEIKRKVLEDLRKESVGTVRTSKPRKSLYRRSWFISFVALATCALIGAFLFSGGGISDPSNMVMHTSIDDLPQRGNKQGTGIKVTSPKDGFLTVLLVGQSGAYDIWPSGDADEIVAESDEEIVVEVFPEPLRQNQAKAVRALTFVTPVGAARDAIRRYVRKLSANDRTSSSLSEDIQTMLLGLNQPWVAHNEIVLSVSK